MRRVRARMVCGLAVCLVAGPAVAQVDVERVQLVKGVDRFDGVIPPLGGGEQPYFYEICASGTGFDTVRVIGPSLDQLFQPPECLEDVANDLIDLDAAVPAGDYQLAFLQQGTQVDSIVVGWSAGASEAFADVLSPPNAATDVNPDVDLEVQWNIDPTSCQPTGVVEDCADSIQLFLVDPLLEADVSENFGIPIDATSWTIDAGLVEPETGYAIELETVKGPQGQPGSTTGGDPVLVTAIFKDINNTSFVTTVPEPGSAALGVAGLGIAGLLAHRRRRPLRVPGSAS